MPSSNDTLVPTAEMLSEEKFWSIVEASLKNYEDQSGQEEFLKEYLQKLEPAEIIGFRLRTDKLLHDSYGSNISCAAYLLNDGLSDDGFEYFRCWLISRGKDVYYAALENPDSLADQINEVEIDYFEFEGFWYVALAAFKAKTGKALYDYIDRDNFKFGEMHYPSFEVTWNQDEPETMVVICPRLFAARGI